MKTAKIYVLLGNVSNILLFVFAVLNYHSGTFDITVLVTTICGIYSLLLACVGFIALAKMGNGNVSSILHKVLLALGILSFINLPGFVFTIPAGVLLITSAWETKNRADVIFQMSQTDGDGANTRAISINRSFQPDQPPENGHFITAGEGRTLLMSLAFLGGTVFIVLFLVFVYHGPVPMRYAGWATHTQGAIFWGIFGYAMFLVMLFYALFLAHRGIIFYYDGSGVTYFPRPKEPVGPIPWKAITGIEIEYTNSGSDVSTLVIHAPVEVRFIMRAVASPKAVLKELTTAWQKATQRQ